MRVLVDSCVLGELCHPKKNRKTAEWFETILNTRFDQIALVVPEIADYELRRELLRGLAKQQIDQRSIDRLDELAALLDYQPLTTDALRDAAQLWADARNAGHPTASNDALDGDVILAAQAREVAGTVVTNNTKHLSLFVDAKHWTEIS
jgi:predicted nucleic acid-binding protein